VEHYKHEHELDEDREPGNEGTREQEGRD
jgi:hypothetical protein